MSVAGRAGEMVEAAPIVAAFPMPGELVERAYDEFDAADTEASDTVKRADLNVRMLARPWDPPTCLLPELRCELWEWLEAVVIWLNREYVWDPSGMIPACWVQHPHLVHEIAVLADRRRRAGFCLTGADLEEFHRYILPEFINRMSARLRAHCDGKDHQPWPARGRHVRHSAEESVRERQRQYAADVRAAAVAHAAAQAGPASGERGDRPGLRSV